jgi:hypothetical protein
VLRFPSRPLGSATAILSAAIAAPGQNTVQVPLNCNFNGVVHAGESGRPDDPNGFRSISDRALDFSAGVPADPLLAPYRIVDLPGVPDIVHLGNRNTVDNGNWAFDPVPDGDDIGIRPSWLPNADQTGPQTTVLAAPVLLGITSSASFLFQISNGGGAFDVTFTYQSGRTRTATLSGPDWFGGAYAGTERVDRALPGPNLNLVEQVVDLSLDAGETLARIAFGNRSNAVAGCAVLAANVAAAPSPRRVNQVPLLYNFNGIVHAGEDGLPDDPNGFRSISDRALDFTAGVPADPLLQPFALVDRPGAPDIVHLGNRNTVDGGNWAFDPAPDGDDVGIRPNWLPDPDQTGPQTTVLAAPILLDAASTASFLFQVSNGGGAFDVTFGFAGGGSVTATLGAGDWFGGPFPGRNRVDRGVIGGPLSIAQRTVDLGAAAGLVLASITFGNASNPLAGVAILAANVSGCLACANAGAALPLGGGNGPTVAATGTGPIGCELGWAVAGATPNTLLGFVAVGFGGGPVPLAALFAGCAGTVHVQNPLAVPVAVDGAGRAALLVQVPPWPQWCGVAVTGQYAELVAAPCPILLGDALTITVGN